MSMEWKLRRFLDKHTVDYKDSKRAFVVACMSPSCGKEDHCYVWKSDGGSICFRCGAKTGWRRMVANISGCQISRSYEVLHGQGAGDDLERQLECDFHFPFNLSDEEASWPPEPEIILGPDFIPIHESDVALKYMAFRGVTDTALMFSYDLRYHAAMNAVVFPVKREAKIYGWQARRIDPKEGELRLISHVFSKSRFLLNWDYARCADKVALVEGPIDCLHVDKMLGMSSVASLGKGISRDQIKLILDMPAKHLYLGLDPDASEEVYEVIGRIGLAKQIYRIKPPAHRKDFGECNNHEVVSSIAGAQRITGQSDFLEVHFK